MKETGKYDSQEKFCEMLTMRMASDVGAAPTLMAAHFKDSLALMKLVQHDFSEFESIKDKTVISLATMLKLIHSLDVAPYHNLLAHRNKFLPILLNGIYSLISDHEHLYSYRHILSIIYNLSEFLQHYKTCVCHYDLHPWNLLFDKVKQKVIAIDFESVCLGDELYDLATIGAYLRLNNMQECLLLQHYYDGQLREEIRFRYLLNKIQITLFYSLGFIFDQL